MYSYITDLHAIDMGYYVFAQNPANYSVRTLYVPVGTVGSYQADTKWSDYFGSIVEMTTSAGDVDGDGVVGISDLSALIDLLLMGGEINPGADVDGDGEVTIADVSALIDILLDAN